MKSLVTHTTFLLLILITSASAQALDITWGLYLRPSLTAGPILSRTLSAGQPFEIEDCTLTGTQQRYRDIIESIEGTSFILSSLPVERNVEIRIILNVSGDTFDSASSVPTFFNAGFETIINGTSHSDYALQSGSPLIMTIPTGTGLDFLLSMCSLSDSDDLSFVYFTGGMFDRRDITTSMTTSSIRVTLSKLTTIVGGQGEDFGFPPAQKITTWRKLKEMFK